MSARLIMEPCPPELQDAEGWPVYGGRLFYNPDTGLAGCSNPDCGWQGVPTISDGDVQRIRAVLRGRRVVETRRLSRGDRPSVISTRCPSCESTLDADWRAVERGLMLHKRVRGPRRVPRNQACPCGSGVKAKRCDCKAYSV